MLFWIREIAGWVLVLASLWLIRLGLTFVSELSAQMSDVDRMLCRFVGNRSRNTYDDFTSGEICSLRCWIWLITSSSDRSS